MPKQTKHSRHGQKILVTDDERVARVVRRLLPHWRVTHIDPNIVAWPDYPELGICIKTMRPRWEVDHELVRQLQKMSEYRVYLATEPTPRGEFFASIMQETLPLAKRVRLMRLTVRGLHKAIASAKQVDLPVAQAYWVRVAMDRMIAVKGRAVLHEIMHAPEDLPINRTIGVILQILAEKEQHIRSTCKDPEAKVWRVGVTLESGETIYSGQMTRIRAKMVAHLLETNKYRVSIDDEPTVMREKSPFSMINVMREVHSNSSPGSAYAEMLDIYLQGHIEFPEGDGDLCVRMAPEAIRKVSRGNVGKLAIRCWGESSNPTYSSQRIRWCHSIHRKQILLTHTSKSGGSWDEMHQYLLDAEKTLVTASHVEIHDPQKTPYTVGSLLKTLRDIGVNDIGHFVRNLQRAIDAGFITTEDSSLRLSQTGELVGRVLNRVFSSAASPRMIPKIEAMLHGVAEGKTSPEKVLRLFWRNCMTTAVTTEWCSINQVFGSEVPTCDNLRVHMRVPMRLIYKPTPVLQCPEPGCMSISGIDFTADGELTSFHSAPSGHQCPQCGSATIYGLCGTGRYLFCAVCRKRVEQC